MATIKAVNVSGKIMEVRLDTDTETIGEKIFMQAPGASMQQLDLDRLEPACGFLSRKGIYAKIQSVSASGNIIRAKMCRLTTMVQKKRLRCSSKPLSNRDQGGRP